MYLFFFQAEDGIRDFCLSRGLGDVYKRQVQIESAKRWQEVEFEFVGGIRWPKGWNTKIRETIKNLFEWRLRLKAEKNPLESIVKLIMNSAYGKLAQKPHDEKIKWVRGDRDKALEKACEAGSGLIYLESANRDRTLWKIKYRIPQTRHQNYAHCGLSLIHI